MAEDGKIDIKTLEIISEYNLCETFGWTPEQLNEMDPFYVEAFSAIMGGKSKVDKT